MDANGNMITMTQTSTGNVWTYGYDFRNRLTSAVEKTSGGTTLESVTYTYDALDNRIGMDENGTQTWTLYNGSSPIMDFSSTGSFETRYVNGPTGNLVDTVLGRESAGGTIAWYLPDRLGTIRDLINNSGSIIDHVDYSAFGSVLGESSPSNGDRMIGFAGLERDGVTGLNLAVEREENPATGRWDSQDPLAFAAGDSDLYRYVGNEPTNASDTTGLQEPKQPTAGDLRGMPQIRDWMTDLLRWSREGTDKVHEEGAWIFWNPKTGRIRVLRDKPSKMVTNGKGRAHIFFGPIPNVPGCVLIGMIHTHPDPVEGGFNPDPGGSDKDKANQPGYGVPWIVPTTKHGVFILQGGTESDQDN
jgi:RHS repeat-associated protein